jgi:hypothetical protein
MFVLDDNDRAVIPYIIENYRIISQKLDEVRDFCDKMKEKLNE